MPTPPVDLTQRLSPHFTLAELCRSERAAALKLDNTPPAGAVANLRRLCLEVLEPVRDQFGAYRVTSGYRSPTLNGQTPGSSKTSAHPDGRAADGQPDSVRVPADLIDVVRWVVASKLPFDQVIYESVKDRYDAVHRWVHLGIAALGAAPRRQALMTFDAKKYLPFDVKKIDLTSGGFKG